MRFKRLHLHGYKTFANKTDFIFDEGVTAIVGPNGSGKSNVADAIRWVLGEQAYGVLRGKKTEDMIFSGSNQRARMGMAEAVITLDNSDNWLPVEFDEVVIGRRAYRSGENEYFLNGSRVRLRDISELLDRSGLGRRTSTVIGQGMIDQALALRPEDRRLLFEEAAGISAYQRKRGQTLERLQQTEDNLTRVRDIIAEIAPRLRALERQADRTRQYDEISVQLRQLLVVWHGYHWQYSLSRLIDARSSVTHWQEIVGRSAAEIETFTASTGELRARQASLRWQLSEWRQQRSQIDAQLSAVTRDLAVGRERERSLHAESERLAHDLELLNERLAGEQVRQSEAEAALAATQSQQQEHQAQLAQARSELAEQETGRRQTESELSATRTAQLQLTTRLSERKNRLEQTRERRQTLQSERDSEIQAAELAAAQTTEIQQEHDAASAALKTLGEQIAELRRRNQEAEARRQEHLAQRAEHEQQRAELEAEQRARRARFELLDRMRAEGEGLFAGVRRVQQASQQGQLSGIVGPVATLLDVPARYEQAIEVALGARLQDVVVRTWDDAEKAIGWLKRERGGRATFLPLDNLRPQARRPAPKEKGVLGWAADLVRFDKEVAPAVELLLGQILVVEDLAAARQVSRGADRPRIVTLEGDFVHPGGSVSGGSQEDRQRSNVLAREREWRSLPEQINSAAAQLKEKQQEIESLSQAIRAVEEALTELVRQASQLGNEERERAAVLNRLQASIDRTRQTEAWHRQRAQKQAAELEELGRQLARLREEIDESGPQLTQLDNRIAALSERLATLTTDGLVQAVAQAQARLSTSTAALRGQQELLASHRSAVQRTTAEMQQRQQRLQAVSAETTALQEQIAKLQSQLERTQRAQDELLATLQPAQTELDALEAGWGKHDQQGDALRQRLHQEELQLNQAQLALQRSEDHLSYLRSEIEHDFGLVSLVTDAVYETQEPLPFDQIVTALPKVEELPLETESEIQRLKGVLSRLGSINPEAPVEYTTTLERYQFLTQQAGDLEQATAQLQQVIAELDQLMEQEFHRTFQAVAKEFTRYFTRLFGGGTARLLLTQPENIMTTGVDIVARPPGKRPTNLAMLSGGERALTAAALIFAILSVSPTPFCILDEVDAALDEANVGRFRDVIHELSDRTQFILITHNRGTIEAARTIYGISMASDSVSQSLSLKVEDGKLNAA